MTPYDDTTGLPGRPEPSADPWAIVARAVTLLAIDPAGLRGLWLRGRAGPVRARVLKGLNALHPRKLHPFTPEEALSGGMDLSATLATGEMQRHAGLLENAGLLMLSMAERCPPGLAVRLGQALDSDRKLALVALDEAAEDGEGLPQALVDRLGLFVELEQFAWGETADLTLSAPVIALATARLPSIATGDALARLTSVAAQLGIDSLRAPSLALACARAHAAWRGAAQVEEADLEVAVALCFAHKAHHFPQDAPLEETPPPPPPEDMPEDEGRAQDESRTEIPEDMLIAAARAALPPGLIAKLQAARFARAQGGNSGAGAKRKSRARGRPLPARPGAPGSGNRIDVIATLRQAAPWQKMRRAMMPGREGRLLLMPSDIRIKRYQDQTDRVLIFVVDASGSSALARLGEAKGAVELMLADAYATRDHVALVAFRGQAAELCLPPSRSLVQTKRRLAGLPGGGATPLASALKLALEVAERARGQGMTPTLAFLTDGRGNIALDGSADRAHATLEASQLARAIAAKCIPALMIDTSLRPKPQLSELSAQMGATLIALPRADAQSLSTTLKTAIGG